MEGRRRDRVEIDDLLQGDVQGKLNSDVGEQGVGPGAGSYDQRLGPILLVGRHDLDFAAGSRIEVTGAESIRVAPFSIAELR